MNQWTQSQAIELCVKIEGICPNVGWHVALTGGLLYRQGNRKDCDLVFYRIRQSTEELEIAIDNLFARLESIGIHKKGFATGFVQKVEYEGRQIDCLFPDVGQNSELPYPPELEQKKSLTNQSGWDHFQT